MEKEMSHSRPQRSQDNISGTLNHRCRNLLVIRFREMANSIIHREIFDIKENLKMAKSMGRGRFI